jgi:hypothetical protein
MRNVALWVVLMAWLAGSPALATYSFSGLGDLAGGSFNSRASRVSADGSVVVGNGTSQNSSADRKNKPRIRSAREYRICRIGLQRLARLGRGGRELLSPHRAISLLNSGDLTTCYLAGAAESLLELPILLGHVGQFHLGSWVCRAYRDA